MPYNELLKKVIKDSNYKNKDIIEELKKENINMDKSYLSKLLNGKLPVPREEISRAIARICNVDERLLVIEGYLEKAPHEITDIFYYIRKVTAYSSLSAISNIKDILDKNSLELLEEQLHQESLSTFLIELLDFKENDKMDLINGFLSVSSDKENFAFQLEEPVSFFIDNKDMSPIIPKNSKITLELLDNYKNGDIIAVKYDNEILVRYYFMNNGIISFNAINKDAKSIDINKKDTKILGKVKRIITDIQ